VNRILVQALGVVLALVIGLGAGWHAKGVSVAAGQTKTARAETQVVITGVKQQADEQHEAQVAEQGKSIALGTEQAGIRATGDKLQQEIDRATFHVTAPNIVVATPTMALRCPDDPVGSDDFVRLYNAAARGADPAAAASTSAR
jgi:hypothetical protein